MDLDSATSEISLEIPLFEMLGESEGLDSLIYVYFTLSNLIAAFQSYAKSDIVRICDAVNSFVHIDNSLAAGFSSNNYNNLMEIRTTVSDSISDSPYVNPPSLSQDSFLVKWQSAEDLCVVINDRLVNLAEKLDAYINCLLTLVNSDDALSGSAADAFKLYFNDVHIPIVELLASTALDVRAQLLSFKENIVSTLDEYEGCVLPELSIDNTISALNSVQDSFESEIENVNSILSSCESSYGNIILPIPNGEPLLSKFEQASSALNAFVENIVDFEVNNSEEIVSYIDDRYSNIVALFSSMLTVGIECYDPQVVNFAEYTWLRDNSYADYDEYVRHNVDAIIDSANGDPDNLSEADRSYLESVLDNCIEDRYCGGDDVESVSDTRRNIVLDVYGILEPENAEIMNDLLDDITDLDPDNPEYADIVADIEYIVITADPTMRESFLFTAQRIVLNPGYPADQTGNYSYDDDPSTPQMGVINLNPDSFNSSDGPYCNFFHEFGHATDNVYAREIYGGDCNSSLSNMTDDRTGLSMRDQVIQDVRNEIDNTMINSPITLAPAEREEVLDVVCSNQCFYYSEENRELDEASGTDIMTVNYPADWTDDMKRAYTYLIRYYGGQSYEYYYDVEADHTHISGVRIGGDDPNGMDLSGNQYGCVSDIMGGVTNNTICGSHNHGLDCGSFNDNDDYCGVHHSDEDIENMMSEYTYWYNDDGTTKPNISSECYAEMYSYEMTGNTSMESGTREVLNGSYDMMEYLIATAVDGQ